MPQLSGPEQKVLVDLIAEHLTEPGQLDRALLHAGLGNLSRLSTHGTLDAIASEVVRELAARYQIIELVKAVLNGDFLQGQCPPIELWLSANLEELIRRRDNPTLVERIPDLAAHPLSRWILGAVVVVASALVFATRPSPPDPLNPKQGSEDKRGEPAFGTGLLHGQDFNLQQSLSALATIHQSRPSESSENLETLLNTITDAGEFGAVFVSNPTAAMVRNASVSVGVDEPNGAKIEDRKGLVEIFYLLPDQSMDGRWSAGLRTKNGTVHEEYPGDLPTGTIIVVIFHQTAPRTSGPKLEVMLLAPT